MQETIPFDWKQEVLSRLDALGSHVGAISGQVWEALIRQQRVDFLIQLGYTLLLMAMTVFLYSVAFVLRRNRPKDDRYFFPPGYNDPSSAGVTLIVAFVFTVASFITALVTIGDLGKILNPEYSAIKDLLFMLRH